MIKPQPLLYKSSVTIGRYNIPHMGHVDLVAKMLEHSEIARVYVSTGKQNNDWDTRVLMFKHLCRTQGLDLSRVYFLKASSPFSAVQSSVENSKYKETAIVLGEDQSQMAATLSENFDCPFILNRRLTSSTEVRFFLDEPSLSKELWEAYKGSSYAVRLVRKLRKEETRREKSKKASRKA